MDYGQPRNFQKSSNDGWFGGHLAFHLLRWATDFQFIEGQPNSQTGRLAKQEHLMNQEIAESVRTLFICIWFMTIAAGDQLFRYWRRLGL